MIFLVAVSSLLLAGCATSRRSQSSASVVQYLFPRDASPQVRTGPPVLRLPTRVGIAFAPPGQEKSGNFYYSSDDLSEAAKANLLNTVATNFLQYRFIKSVEIIPGAYLRPGGSFENLDQLKRMFDVDIIALVSYDQTQFTDRDFTSFAYWTILGLYTVEGEKNDTQTLMDAVVYDIDTRTLLLRAPGVSRVKARATPINLSEELRDDRQTGFNQAATNLVSNLQGQLASFQEKVKQRPEEYKVVTRPGESWGGAIDPLDLAIISAIAMVGGVTLRKPKAA